MEENGNIYKSSAGALAYRVILYLMQVDWTGITCHLKAKVANPNNRIGTPIPKPTPKAIVSDELLNPSFSLDPSVCVASFSSASERVDTGDRLVDVTSEHLIGIILSFELMAINLSGSSLF